MRRIGIVAVLSAVTLASAAAGLVVSDADAGPKKGAKKDAAPAAIPDPPTTKTPIRLAPEGLHWGMSVDDVAAFYDKVLDKDYVPLYRKVQPGPQMNALDADLQDKKLAFRRSRIDFGTLPTGIDQTALAGEYNYKNNESMLSLTRDGQTRYFFFYQQKLWKTYDDVPLRDGGPLGKSYEDALHAIEHQLGVAGRALPADGAAGRRFNEADWVDATSHVRALDRGYENVVGLVYEDRSTATTLANVKKANAANTDSIDPAILAVTRGGDGGIVDPNARAADAYTGRSHGGADQPKKSK